jgi:hypothetical protein
MYICLLAEEVRGIFMRRRKKDEDKRGRFACRDRECIRLELYYS